jgi:hypothetical protein
MKWTVASILAFIGLNVGMLAVEMGSHGGDAWPALMFCGPAYLLAAPMGDSLGYVFVMIIGTALLYGAYGWSLVHFRWWKALLTIALVNAPFVLLSMVFLNSN